MSNSNPAEKDGNWLQARQNSPDALRWIAASSDRYGRAKQMLFFQVVVGVFIPFVLSIVKLLIPELGGWAAFYGVVVAVVDLAILDTSYKRYLKQGALAQERFDSDVLGFDWNDERAGARPTKADAVVWSLKYLEHYPDQAKHMNWYPVSAGTIPQSFGRLICQLSNCRWDSNLRKRYCGTLFGSALALVMGVIIISLARRTTVEELFLTLSTLLPVISWALRSWKTQSEIIDSVEEQRKRIESLWARSLRNELEQPRIESTARAIQDDIFSRRKGSQPVFNRIYRRFRTRDEMEMNRVAEAMVEEYRASAKA